MKVDKRVDFFFSRLPLEYNFILIFLYNVINNNINVSGAINAADARVIFILLDWYIYARTATLC